MSTLCILDFYGLHGRNGGKNASEDEINCACFNSLGFVTDSGHRNRNNPICCHEGLEAKAQTSYQCALSSTVIKLINKVGVITHQRV